MVSKKVDPATSRDTTPLSALRPGEIGQVVRISPVVDGLARRRLLDLGLVPGTPVTVAFTSPAGNPTAYQVRGALIALRTAQAAKIEVERRRA
jgi:ferrous iron transport protein A